MGRADLLRGSGACEQAVHLHHRRELSSPGAQGTKISDGRSDLKLSNKITSSFCF